LACFDQISGLFRVTEWDTVLMNHSRPPWESMKEAPPPQPTPTASKGKFKVFLETARLPALATSFRQLRVAAPPLATSFR